MQRVQRMFVVSVSGTSVTLSPDANAPNNQGGIGIASALIITTETTAESAFYGTTGTCAVFDLILRKVQ